MVTLTAAMLALFMTGMTHYVDVGRGTDAVIYYETESRAHMRLPGSDAVLTGDWRLTANGYHVSWRGGPAGDWSIRQTNAGRFEYVDGGGQPRGVITRLQPGDAARLVR
jgi:hypothetical protein